MSEELTHSNSQRIAKNAVMLYIRMFLTMIVGLYASRAVLDVLSVEDYGTSSVVVGVVAMIGYLNLSEMASGLLPSSANTPRNT